MNVTEETLKMLAEARDATKAFTVSTGLVNYDLEAPAKTLYPVLTPLRNMIPRVKGNGDTATRWKAVTGINTANLTAGVEEGKRGGVLTTTVASYTAAYAGLGVEDSVTFEATYAGQGFQDPRTQAVRGALQSLMLQEEKTIYGGWASGTLAAPGQASGVASGTGTVANAAQLCTVVALTVDGLARSSVAGGVVLSASRTNADGTTTTIAGGHSAKSTVSASVTPSGTQLITWVCGASQGAAAYAWFIGVSGSQLLAAITPVNKFIQVAVASGTQNLTALGGDDTPDATVFDGLMAFYGKSANNAYYRTLDGATLTTDNAGGVTELNTAFQWFWDNQRLSPSRIIVSAAQALKISQIVMGNSGGAGLYSIFANAGADSQRGFVGGTFVRSLLNPFFGGGVSVDIMIHPAAAAGTIMFDTDTLPYQNSDIPDVRRIKTRQEYYQTEWPLKTRKYEYGVYVDELLQHYFPPAGGLLQNVG